MDVNICSQNGDFFVGEFNVTSDTKPHDLPEMFNIGNAIQVQVLKEKVPCVFASVSFKEKNIITKIDLRFENQILVSIFVELTDSDKKYEDESSYYNGVQEREALHLKWIKDKLGNTQEKYTSYNWGIVGVAQDRNGGVHIFLHNKNNAWAKT